MTANDIDPASATRSAGPKLKNPFQFSMVVPDVDAATKLWWEVYGIGPWEISNFDSSRIEEATSDGEPADYALRIAMTHWGPLELELIQPLDDRSHIARFLAENGGRPHFHHLHVHVDDYDQTLEFLAGRGIEPKLAGRIGEVRFAYVGTDKDLGAMVEIAARPDDWQWPVPDEIYPPRDNQAS